VREPIAGYRDGDRRPRIVVGMRGFGTYNASATDDGARAVAVDQVGERHQNVDKGL
jgi:hypothetical protein